MLVSGTRWALPQPTHRRGHHYIIINRNIEVLLMLAVKNRVHPYHGFFPSHQVCSPSHYTDCRSGPVYVQQSEAGYPSAAARFGLQRRVTLQSCSQLDCKVRFPSPVAAKSMRQYMPAITDGGLPTGM